MITASLVIYNSDLNKLCETIETFLLQQIEKYLVIIDNASPKRETINFITEKYNTHKEIAIVNNLSNKGYGAGNNLGFLIAQQFAKIKNCDILYHVVLNPDLIITHNCFSKMSSYMDSHPEIGLLVPKICNIDGSTQEINKEHPTVFDLFARRFLPNFIAKKNFFINRDNYYTRKAFGYDKIVAVPFASGCFMMFRAEIYIKLNGFDENFFLYMEDADISRRANNICKVLFYPEAVVKHHWDRATHKNYKMTLRAIYSAIIYFQKHGLKFY